MSNQSEKLKMLDDLLNSDVEENRVLGSLLLSTIDLPREEVLSRIKPTLDDFVKEKQVNPDVLNNFIDIYLSLNNKDLVKNRVKKI